MPRDIPLPQGLRPPSRRAQLGELALPFDMLRYGLGAHRLIGAPRGDGRPVALLPGYRASELSMRPLEVWLRHLGYQVRDWGMGRNEGRLAVDVERFAAQASEWAGKEGAPLTLIGWSLGGVIARETARRYPHLVREIITMGSPIIGGPKYTALARRFTGRDFDAYEREIHARNLQGLTQPLTVIYSDRDGIVGPDIAIDIYNPQARNRKVDATHLGLGISPQVWRIIADTLAGT
ncbi:MAG: hypothetical protein CVT74_07390 [Alphaproteobacteria bacterium HGW-Alphaproteobacteria-13]|jgi:pimeloyl-ACP methyl ester carboxylesterase|nr:MAG: hypothetical protein CVT74_07390 [Alphaproteobacteria bacterium HGW-Alphaproteobacteria-13]